MTLNRFVTDQIQNNPKQRRNGVSLPEPKWETYKVHRHNRMNKRANVVFSTPNAHPHRFVCNVLYLPT